MNTARVLEILREDAAFAEASTVCNRRGTAARAVDIWTDVVSDVAVAFNGSPHCTSSEGSCGCVHAEQRLILNLAQSHSPKRRFTLLTTLEPCESCANLIVESNLFSNVFFLREYRGGKGRVILRRSDIPCKQVQ